MITKIKSWLFFAKRILSKTITNAVKHEVPLHGAAIAFYTIFSIAPLFVIILSISQFLLAEELVQQKLYSMVAEFTGPQMSESIQKIIEAYSSSPSNIFAYALAIIMVIFGATTVITQLKSSLNTIWHVEERKFNVVYQYLIDRAVSFLIIIITTALFICVLFLEAVTPLITNFFDFFIPDAFVSFLILGLPVSSFILSLLFFYIIFRILPDVRIPRKDVFTGALFTAVLFILGKYLVGLYLGNSSIQVAYRAAGSFVVFLIWVYYNVQIILLGAEFTYVYANRDKLEEN